MSTDELAHGEQLPVPRRRGLAFGEAEPPPEVAATKADTGPLDSRTEAMLAFAIVTPVVAAYSAVAYGAVLALNRLLGRRSLAHDSRELRRVRLRCISWSLR